MGAAHAVAKLGLESLTKLKNGRKGCATVRHGVIPVAVASGDLLFEIQQGVEPFSISTGLGMDPFITAHSYSQTSGSW